MKYFVVLVKYEMYNVIGFNLIFVLNENIILIFYNGLEIILIVLKQIYFGLNIVLVGMKLDDGVNFFGLIVFFIIFGIVIGKFGFKGKLFVEFFLILNDVVLMLVILIMW